MTVEVRVTRPTVALELSGGRGATGAAGRDLDPRQAHDAAGAARVAAAVYTMTFQGLGLGAMALQDPAAVAITGGQISGVVITGAQLSLSVDLAIADGGTGASTAAGARTNFGLGTADSPEFAGINVGAAADTTVTRASAGDIAVEGNIVYRSGGTDVPVTDGGTGSSTAAGARTNLGLGTADSPEFTAVNIGAAADTTVSRASAGDIAVEGNRIFRVGGADVPVADGGTGASTAPAAATNLGLGTLDSPQLAGINVGHATDTTVTRASAGDIAVEGNIVYRAGGTDVPVTDGGTGSSTAAGARTNLGLGTADSPEFAAVNIGAATDTTITRTGAGEIAVEGNRIFRVGGADVPVADGGTGASTAAAARTNLGLTAAFIDLGSLIYRASGAGGSGQTNLFQIFNSAADNTFEVANSDGSKSATLVGTATPGLKVNGSQVVGARGAALPADATDLASVIALANAIKARLKATGGHGLVAD